MAVHSNHPEALRDLMLAWMARHPLAPLEDEWVLVQSNGVAQWLKLSLARDPAQGGIGIAAAHTQIRTDDDYPPGLSAPRRPRTVGVPFTIEGFQSVYSQAGASSPPSNNWIGAPGMMVEIACL